MSAATTEVKDLFVYNSKLYQLQYDVTQVSRVNYKLIKSDADKTTPSDDVSHLTSLPSHLVDSDVYVIDSVYSGVGRENKDLYTSTLLPILKDLGVKHTYIKTESKDTITDFANAIDRSKNYTIMLLSGDTSWFEIVNPIQLNTLSGGAGGKTKKGYVKISPFPLGSGNALSYGSGVHNEADAIKNVLFNDYSSKLPVYKVSFPEGSYDITHPGVKEPIRDLFFLCIVSTGIHAQLVFEAEKPELKHLGIDRFKVAVGTVLRDNIDYHGQILDPESKERLVDSNDFNYVLISAVPLTEKAYLISPDSQLGLNELQAVTFSKFTPEGMGKALVLPYSNGAHINLPNVYYKTLKKTGVIYKFGDEPDERSNICVDGTIIKVTNSKDKEVKIETLSDDFFQVDVIGLKRG